MNAVILSYAQDTNGQNARFVEAARKVGRQAIKAVAIGKDDPAGVVGRYQEGAKKREALVIRSAHRITHYFDFAHDIIWDRHTESDIARLIAESDVVHLNNSHIAASRFRIRKPMLLHHHGSMYRNNPERAHSIARQFRMIQAASTIDLLRFSPDVKWLPTAYDVTTLREYADSHRREADGKVRIVHCPTNRAGKHTELLIATVKKLQKTLPVELVLVEGKTNADVLYEKAKADIVFDQLMWGYGCNSVEAWAMGVPVISGADDWTSSRMTEEWGGLPFYAATEDTLEQAIRDMVESKELRAEWGQRGYEHVLRYHDELPALVRLVELYVEAIEWYDSAHAAVDPVRFVNRGRAFHAVGVQVPVGESTFTDPDVIRRLRYFVASRPGWGIEEVA